MRRLRSSPALTVLVVAPFVGEVMSTATSVFVFLLVIPFHAALYGCGALLVREAVRARGLGLWGLICLGAAYGVVEEAELVRSWFNVAYLPSEGDYARVWDTSLLQAVHLTSFHAAVSVGCSITVTELLHPAHRDRPWASPRALVVAGVAFASLFPLTLIEDSGFFAPHWPQMATALVLAGAMIAAAPRLSRGWPAASDRLSARPLARRVAAAVTVAFVLTYAAPESGLPWPVAVVGVAAIPLLAIPWAIRVLPRTADRRRLGLIAGLIAPFALLNLVLLQPQTWLAALLAILGLVRLRRVVADREARVRHQTPTVAHG